MQSVINNSCQFVPAWAGIRGKKMLLILLSTVSPLGDAFRRSTKDCLILYSCLTAFAANQKLMQFMNSVWKSGSCAISTYSIFLANSFASSRHRRETSIICAPLHAALPTE